MALRPVPVWLCYSPPPPTPQSSWQHFLSLCTATAGLPHPEQPQLDLSANVAHRFIDCVKVRSKQTGRTHMRTSGNSQLLHSPPVPSTAKSPPIPSMAKSPIPSTKSLPVHSTAKSPLPTAANISALPAEASPRRKVERVSSTVLLCFLATGCLRRKVAAPWHIHDPDCVTGGGGLWGKESCPGTLGSAALASVCLRNSCLWFSLPSTEGGRKGSGNTLAAVKS